MSCESILDLYPESRDAVTMITRLSERNLASLYEQCQAPMRLHMALHGVDGIDHAVITDIEGMVRFNPPDLALISLGLCAVVLAEYRARDAANDAAITTEMKYLGIDAVESFGPAWLGEQSGLEDLGDLLELCPIHLCALGSVFEELGDDTPIARILSEIAYDQADRAEALLAGDIPPDITTQTPAATAPTSNVVPLDLFSAWRKHNEPAE